MDTQALQDHSKAVGEVLKSLAIAFKKLTAAMEDLRRRDVQAATQVGSPTNLLIMEAGVARDQVFQAGKALLKHQQKADSMAIRATDEPSGDELARYLTDKLR